MVKMNSLNISLDEVRVTADYVIDRKTPTTFSNGTSITMDAANDSVSMIYGTNGWQIFAAQAITVNA